MLLLSEGEELLESGPAELLLLCDPGGDIECVVNRGPPIVSGMKITRPTQPSARRDAKKG